ncbi:uncharacterized protein [Dysidea avara]|uniref:uncharacterized protein n=1 Tax=Dysidea avara TaxID=196820 RepID=UPI00331844F9
MDVVREIDLSSDSDVSESSDVEIHDSSSDVCGELASSSSCTLLQTHQREETENASESDISTTQKRAQSLLDVLKCPQPSTLARKRAITTNNPPAGKRSCKSTNQRKAAASIKPKQRIDEFKGEHLCVSSGKLFCNACREEVNLKKSSVKNHIRSVKHKNGKDALNTKNKREKTIAEAIQQHNSEVHPRGETLPMEQQVHRVKVVESFLRAAVPLSKLQHFRKLLEETGYRLTDRHHMSDLIPVVLKQEKSRIQGEISEQDVSVIFDGTSRLGEALAMVVRFVTCEWNIEQRLIKVQLLSKSLKGEEIARELIHTLSTEYSIGTDNLLAAMRDRAASNGVAMRTVKVLYPNLVDIGCFSHTIDRVGENFHTPILHEFGIAWVSMFSHSPKTKLLWKELTGKQMISYSPTRWWSRWEVYYQVMVHFGDVEPFLKNNEDLPSATRTKLLSFFTDDKKDKLQVELAAVIDYGEEFVKTTYKLEGDGPLVFTCYEIIDALQIAIKRIETRAPNTEAVINSVSKGSHTVKERLKQHAKTACSLVLHTLIDS